MHRKIVRYLIHAFIGTFGAMMVAAMTAPIWQTLLSIIHPSSKGYDLLMSGWFPLQCFLGLQFGFLVRKKFAKFRDPLPIFVLILALAWWVFQYMTSPGYSLSSYFSDAPDLRTKVHRLASTGVVITSIAYVLGSLLHRSFADHAHSNRARKTNS
jgi:hypothetical protein